MEAPRRLGVLLALTAAMGACDCSERGEGAEGPAWPGYSVERIVGESGSGEGQLHVPLGVAVGPEGALYVADAGNRRVQRFGRDGTFDRELGAETLVRPTDVAVDDDGTVWVADMGADRIRCFRPDGSSCERAPVQAEAPAAIDLRADGTLVAALFEGHRVVELAQLDAAGERDEALERRVAVGGRGAGPGQFHHPTDVAPVPGGGTLVADADNGRIQRLDRGGRALDVWRGPPGDELGKPSGVTTTGTVVHVADATRRSVVALGRGGEMLARWKMTDDADHSVESPVRVEADGGRIYVADAANDRIVVLVPSEAPR